MPNVVIGSIFRNAMPYLNRYFLQGFDLVEKLHARGYQSRFVLAEADSTDLTCSLLRDQRMMIEGKEVPIKVIKRDNGSPVYGSVDLADRWRAISYVCDGVLEQIKSSDDILLYVESDLIWGTATMLHLIDQLDAQCLDAIAPMCFHSAGFFYDTWGYRKDGIRFGPTPPYHPNIGEGITKLDSAGSCIVMRGHVARRCRFIPPEMGIVGFCQSIRASGNQLWLDPTQKVIHP